MTTQRRRPYPRPWRLALLALSPVAFVFIGAHLFVESAGANHASCQDPDHRFLPDYWLLIGSVGAIAAGRIFGPQQHRVPQKRPARQLSDLVGIGAAMLLFAALTAVLIYEGVGVHESQMRAAQAQTIAQQQAHLAELEPITHYVRCAVFNDRGGASATAASVAGLGGWSWFTLIVVGFLTGHWLWSWSPPEGPPETRQEGTSQRAPLWVALSVTLVVSVVMLAGVYFLLDAWLAGRTELSQTIDTARVTGDSFRDGIRAVIAIVFAILVSVSFLDLVFGLRRSPSIALRMQEWAQQNPWFVFGLLVIIGALMAHFVGNVIHYPNDPDYKSVFEHVGNDHLFAFLAAVVTVLGALAVRADGGLASRGVPRGIVDLELAGNMERATQIVDIWRRRGKLVAVRRALLWDFGFIASYVLALVLSCVRATRWFLAQDNPGQGAFIAIGTLFATVSVAAGVCDVIEDIFLLRTMRAFDSVAAGTAPLVTQIDGPARWARAYALGKFGLLIVVLLFVTSTCGVALGQLQHSSIGG